MSTYAHAYRHANYVYKTTFSTLTLKRDISRTFHDKKPPTICIIHRQICHVHTAAPLNRSFAPHWAFYALHKTAHH